MPIANTDKLLKNIKRYVSLTTEETDAFITIVRTSNVVKRQFIVQPGFTCTHQTYVVEGAFRAYLLTADGTEHTVQLAVDDWFISDFYSYISQQPASLFVEALAPSVIQQIEYNEVEQLCTKHPVFERYFRIVAQKAFAFSQQRVLSKLSKTAEERYLEYQAKYPQIVQRVPQYALASYLGITPPFLSQIRQRLSKK